MRQELETKERESRERRDKEKRSFTGTQQQYLHDVHIKQQQKPAICSRVSFSPLHAFHHFLLEAYWVLKR